jgi:hypothetical protein
MLRLSYEIGESRVNVGTDRPRVDHRHTGLGSRIRVRVLAVAEQPVEQDADGEQVGGDIPAGKRGIGRLIRRCARLRMYGVAHPGRDVEVEQFRACPGEHHVERFNVTVD